MSSSKKSEPANTLAHTLASGGFGRISWEVRQGGAYRDGRKPTFRQAANIPRGYGTVKFVALAADPPGVPMAIFPVTAPVGTMAVTCLSEFIVNVAVSPPKVTLVV